MPHITSEPVRHILGFSYCPATASTVYNINSELSSIFLIFSKFIFYFWIQMDNILFENKMIIKLKILIHSHRIMLAFLCEVDYNKINHKERSDLYA